MNLETYIPIWATFIKSLTMIYSLPHRLFLRTVDRTSIFIVYFISLNFPIVKLACVNYTKSNNFAFEEHRCLCLINKGKFSILVCNVKWVSRKTIFQMLSQNYLERRCKVHFNETGGWRGKIILYNSGRVCECSYFYYTMNIIGHFWEIWQCGKFPSSCSLQ